MEIREAREQDAVHLDNLLTMLIHDECQYDRTLDKNFVVKDFYINYIDDSSKFFRIVEVDDEIVGYLYGMLIEDGILYAKLDALFIKEEYRNKGYAKELIEEFISWTKENNCEYAEVSVLKQNNTGKYLYSEMNFKEFKEILRLDFK